MCGSECASHALTYLMLTMNLWNGYYYYPSFTDKNIEAQGDYLALHQITLPDFEFQ